MSSRFRGAFWAKNDGMRSGHWLLVTKPAGAGAGARSREKRPARTTPLLVKFHSGLLTELSRSGSGDDDGMNSGEETSTPTAGTGEAASGQWTASSGPGGQLGGDGSSALERQKAVGQWNTI